MEASTFLLLTSVNLHNFGMLHGWGCLKGEVEVFPFAVEV